MFRKSLNRCMTAGLLTVVAISLPLARLQADIITDIELLDKEKKPEKDQEKKSETETPVSPAKRVKKPAHSEPVPQAEELNQKSELIPEPTEQIVLPPRPSRPSDANVKAKAKTKGERQRAPVHFQNAGLTTYSKDRSTVLLQNSVVITQDDMKLESDDAKITLNPSGTAEGGVKNALLSGKVSITRAAEDPAERMTATSDKAVFDNLQQTVALEGNARLKRDGNTIQGDRIIYEVTTGMIKVDKARGVVQPERMKK